MSEVTQNYNLKLYEGADLFNPLTFENVNFETLDTVLKAISDKAVGNATELKTGTVHALTRAVGEEDRDTFIFTATANFTAGDTFTLDGVQVSALTVAGQQLSTDCYVIGSSVLVHVRDTLLTFYVAETTAQNAERLGGELPSYYAQASALNDVVADVIALATKVGTAVLTTQAQDCSGAINELNTQLTDNGNPPQTQGSTYVVKGVGVIVYMAPNRSYQFSLPFVVKNGASVSVAVSVHGGNDYTFSGSIGAGQSSFRIANEYGPTSSATFSFTATLTFS